VPSRTAATRNTLGPGRGSSHGNEQQAEYRPPSRGNININMRRPSHVVMPLTPLPLPLHMDRGHQYQLCMLFAYMFTYNSYKLTSSAQRGSCSIGRYDCTTERWATFRTPRIIVQVNQPPPRSTGNPGFFFSCGHVKKVESKKYTWVKNV